MKEMLKYLRPYWRGLLVAALTMGLSTICDLLLPTAMSDILNNGVQQRDFDYIFRCCVWMLLIATIGFCATIVGTKVTGEVVAGYCADVRAAVFRRVHQMRFEEFGRLGASALVARATTDVQHISGLASSLGGTIITIPVLFFGGVILSMRKDVLISLLLLAVVPIIFAVVMRIVRKIDPLYVKADEFMDRENDIIRQRLRGIRVIRAFNAEDKEHTRVSDATRTMSENLIRANIMMGTITPFSMLLLNIAAVLAVYFGAWRMETDTGLTGADIFAIVQYVSLISSGLIMAAYTLLMFPQTIVSAGRIGQVLNAEAMADPVARQERILTGDIEFDHVSFSYQGAAEPALHNITLHIRPGEKVAIIGGTGAGKSTLVSLILGFRMPTDGQVKLDGVPSAQLSRYDIRQNISCVLQNSTLYSGTIRENIRMGRTDASDEEIWRALEIAQAADFVRSQPEGLDYVIRQSGKNLSGGQKQRLSIARAVLKNAPIYVFDDSFSALDFLTEANLRAALPRVTDGKTQLLVTQRVSSAMHCDRVFVMDRGELVDEGTHAQLLGRCKIYRQIFASQTGGVVK